MTIVIGAAVAALGGALYFGRGPDPAGPSETVVLEPAHAVVVE